MLKVILNMRGWSGGARVLGNCQCLGVLLIWIIAGKGPTVLSEGVGEGLFVFLSLGDG